MKKTTIVTHNGKFHADDAFAVATLSLMLEKEGIAVQIKRSRDPLVWQTADYLIDVGGENIPEQNKFDHHQRGGGGNRPNSIPYAAFGLVWKKYGAILCGVEAAAVLDNRIVAPIDANDVGTEIVSPMYPGVYPYSISHVISSFLPTWKEKEGDYDVRFMEVLQLAKSILAREIRNAITNEEAKSRVREIYAAATDKRVLVFDAHYSELAWGEVLASFPETLYVIYPNNNSWHVTAVRKDPSRFEARKRFPVAWATKRDGELASITGVPDAVFCHNSGHLAVATSKEGALELARRAVES